ncbi:mitochondrial ribosomal protein subunit L53 [Schizosaccharomyces pombe]|uniref:Large ribosomal subunit protein mL53 n=1 Tax=Schizosaccharomyces pombe (strain 972 / ATCC 24843) TaxID=284812 RepID=RM44_SCHPO|nr:putative mitochondrial ribosomal protein subunit l44 [Schizosaccharomyces pombe]P62506.1 RecName: Full=Large ribosomal subunit protein mL53; AltName: Full=54S ribosomal protein L44, mitochondrial [Schizosaccharomyces pombe 972h-]CAG17623.1 mitochondrial ribosomal protein subunit l44 (predicted) [Schizosaccharomyces pombe]|eukprot:NP_001018846.1 putative mitochondrial ribosomal protein subunit l44 [Schizosaccharomyces pombe]
MIFGYINKLSILNVNPFSKASQSAKLLLAVASKETSNSLYGLNLITSLASKDTNSKPSVEVVYKDGKKLTVDPTKMNIGRLTELIDDYSKTLKFKEMMQK